jgi:hypothetical protein
MKGNARSFMIFSLFCLSHNVFSQKIEKYYFESRDDSFVNSLPKVGFDYSFQSQRIIDKTKIIDDKIFCQSNKIDCSFIHKRSKNGDYLILINGKWEMFFIEKSKKINTINILKDSAVLKPLNVTNVVKGHKIYGFTFELKKWIQTYRTIYWFEPDYGIIAIQNLSVNLVRNDF